MQILERPARHGTRLGISKVVVSVALLAIHPALLFADTTAGSATGPSRLPGSADGNSTENVVPEQVQPSQEKEVEEQDISGQPLNVVKGADGTGDNNKEQQAQQHEKRARQELGSAKVSEGDSDQKDQRPNDGREAASEVRNQAYKDAGLRAMATGVGCLCGAIPGALCCGISPLSLTLVGGLGGLAGVILAGIAAILLPIPCACYGATWTIPMGNAIAGLVYDGTSGIVDAFIASGVAIAIHLANVVLASSAALAVVISMEDGNDTALVIAGIVGLYLLTAPIAPVVGYVVYNCLRFDWEQIGEVENSDTRKSLPEQSATLSSEQTSSMNY